MNGILGYLRIDGAPVATAKLAAMQKAMAYWGVDGSAEWSDGLAGLGCQFCFCTPEEKERSLPYYDKERGWVLTAGAFLDNREELIDELGLSAEEGRVLPDTLLIHRGYARWGEDCVHHLLGDWHFALWDLKNRRLFLARDHYGITGVCYTQGPGFFAFASSRKALLALPEVPQEPNLLRLAQVLTCWPGDGVLTAYAGIYRLPPAHCLSVADGEVKIKQYWFAENAREVHFPREEDYLEAFLEHYDRAVRARLRSNTAISATLSGGLDSGSVCALAARELAKRGQRLSAFTSVPLENTSPYTAKQRFGDESEFAQATANQAGNIDLTWIKAAGVSPLAGIARMLRMHDEPSHAAGNYFWIAALLQRARERSFRVLLTGQGGNATVSWTGGAVNLWPYLWPWKLKLFKQSFLDMQKRQGLSFLGGVKRFLAGPLVAPLRSRMQYGICSNGPVFLQYSAIHPRWAHSLHLDRLMQAQGHDPYFRTGYDPLAARYKIIQPGQSVGGGLWGEISAAYGMEMRDPTVDQRLLEFCLGVPDIYHYAEGLDRALLRRALRGLLPDKVRLNRRIGLQAADICRRLRRHATEIEEALHHLERHTLAPEVLDLPKMRRVLQSIQPGTTRENTGEAGTILLRGLGVGMFLLRF
ncbi:MAG: asparagine synthase-related protein [Desulfobaccales bacterium]